MDEAIERAVKFSIDNWDALGVLAHGDILHLPASIKRRDAKGGLVEVPVMLRNVTNQHRYTARVQARSLAASLNFDLDRDRDLVEELENYAILAYAIRDPKPPFDQHVPSAEELLKRYDNKSLAEVWGRFNVWVEMLDPRFGELDAEQLWQVIVRVAKERTPVPLVRLAGAAQYSCIVHMALAAMSSPMRPSWVDSSEIFKPGSSAANN